MDDALFVGGFERVRDLLGDGQCFFDRDGAARDALRQIVADAGPRLCVILSVDLAHIGGRFGDRFTVNPEVLRQLEHEDRATLQVASVSQLARVLGRIEQLKDVLAVTRDLG